MAAAAGIVHLFYNDPGYGYYATIDHGAGFVSLYAHFRSTSPFAVSEGSRVAQGQTIGFADSTGNSTGNHLHFRMNLNGNAYKPEPMSNIPGPGDSQTSTFGQYGYCGSNPSPYWTSRAPYAGIEGTLVKAGGASVYIIDHGQKRGISGAVFTTCYQWADISVIDQATLDSLPPGPNVTTLPCPGTLVKTAASGTVWVVSSGWKRPLAGAGLLTWCYPGAGIVTVTQSQLDSVPTGFTLYGPPCPYIRHSWYDTAAINGALVKGSGGTVYVLEAGTRRTIPSGALFESCGYLWPTIVTISDQALNAIPLGITLSGRPCPYTMDVVGAGTVYVIENFQKRALAGAGLIDWCGYFWSNLISISQQEMNSIGTGSTLYSPPCPYGRH